MTGPELRAALAALGVSQRWLARRCGVSASTVFRWCKGDLPVPQYAAFVVYLLGNLPADRLALMRREF